MGIYALFYEKGLGLRVAECGSSQIRNVMTGIALLMQQT